MLIHRILTRALSQGRVRQVALLATNHVPAVCNHFGRCEKTVALLRALSHPVPRLWEALEEPEPMEWSVTDPATNKVPPPPVRVPRSSLTCGLVAQVYTKREVLALRARHIARLSAICRLLQVF